jgi:hypothetical protein
MKAVAAGCGTSLKELDLEGCDNISYKRMSAVKRSHPLERTSRSERQQSRAYVSVLIISTNTRRRALVTHTTHGVSPSKYSKIGRSYYYYYCASGRF